MTEFDRFRKVCSCDPLTNRDSAIRAQRLSLLAAYFQYNPQEISLAFNKAKKDETGRVNQAGRDGNIPTEPSATVEGAEAEPPQPEREVAPLAGKASQTTNAEP